MNQGGCHSKENKGCKGSRALGGSREAPRVAGGVSEYSVQEEVALRLGWQGAHQSERTAQERKKAAEQDKPRGARMTGEENKWRVLPSSHETRIGPRLQHQAHSQAWDSGLLLSMHKALG